MYRQSNRRVENSQGYDDHIHFFTAKMKDGLGAPEQPHKHCEFAIPIMRIIGCCGQPVWGTWKTEGATARGRAFQSTHPPTFGLDGCFNSSCVSVGIEVSICLDSGVRTRWKRMLKQQHNILKFYICYRPVMIAICVNHYTSSKYF